MWRWTFVCLQNIHLQNYSDTYPFVFYILKSPYRLVHCSIQSRINGNDLWRNWLLFNWTTYYNVLFYFSLISGSSYTCLAISLERYMGICYPNTSSRFRKLRYYSVAIVLACFLIDAPRFLEVEVRNTLPKTLKRVPELIFGSEQVYIIAGS